MRVTFWPRPSASPGPLDREAYCEHCGYNLRGLTELRCPECGTPFVPKAPSGSLLPWKQRRAIGRLEAYVRTVWMVVARPRRFADEVWLAGTISHREARTFRLITVAIAFVSLAMVALAGLGPRLSAQRFIPYSLACAVLLAVWLERSTGLIVRFFRKQILRRDVQQRCVALGHMSCSALAFSPLHVLMLVALSSSARFDPTGGQITGAVAIAWLVLAGVQLAAWLRSVMSLVSESMRCNEAELVGVGLLFSGVWTAHACWFLLALPLGLHLVGSVMLGLF
jgi:hypothetical protein